MQSAKVVTSKKEHGGAWCRCKDPKFQINNKTAEITCGKCTHGFERDRRRRLRRSILRGIEKGRKKVYPPEITKYLPTKKHR